MLTRSFDAGFLNGVVNDPSVAPWVTLGTKQFLDMTDAVSNPDNVFLANEWGGFLFIKDGDTYEVHTQFLEEGRGVLALKAAREAAFYMFTRTNCLAIRTYVPKGNVAAAALTKLMGFSHWGSAKINGHECRLFMLTLKCWAKGLKCQP